jgi:hypothetical protein
LKTTRSILFAKAFHFSRRSAKGPSAAEHAILF